MFLAGHSVAMQTYCVTKIIPTYSPVIGQFLLMDVYIQERSGQSNCTRSLTHSILINLFIKLELNNFLLPPLLSIVFVQECSVVFRKVFDEGRLERRTFLPEKWRAWVRVSKIDLGGHCGFTCLQFFFRKYDGF